MQTNVIQVCWDSHSSVSENNRPRAPGSAVFFAEEGQRKCNRLFFEMFNSLMKAFKPTRLLR